MKKQFRSFEDAKEFAHFLKLKNEREWKEYCKSGKKPENMPSTPSRTYRKEWKGMGDWLDTGYVANQKRNYQSFEDAREFAHSLKLNYFSDWKSYCKLSKKQKDIPNYPNIVYKKEWIGWGDWLGTGRIANQKRTYSSFNEAKKFVRKLKISSQTEWFNKYCKSGNKPADIPSNVQHIYKKEWKGWGDFIGTGNVAPKDREFRAFEDARRIVIKLKFKNRNDWKKFVKSKNFPSDLPKDPTISYKKEWKTWGDFLGTGTIQNQKRKYLSKLDAQKIVHKIAKKYNIRTYEDWKLAVKKGLIPDNIPATPWSIYSKERKRK